MSLRKRRTIFKYNKKWIAGFLFTFFLIIILAGGLISGVIYYFYKDLPEVETLADFHPALVSNVLDEKGEPIGSFFVERRIYVKLANIPQHLFQAILAVEDSRFFKHKGIDYIGILRALITNIEAGKIRQGASTITQQLARSIYLNSERSYERKIREALLALKMEKYLTKEEILELYINQIYFGSGAYGVQAASYAYFGKDVSQLKLSEAAFIAGLPKGPTAYSPYNNPELAKKRQGVVLRRMVDEKYITQEEYEEAYRQDLFFRRPEKKEKAGKYFLEMVRQYLEKKYGEDAVYRGGLTVKTTLNIEMQTDAEEAVRKGLREIDKRHGFRGPEKHYTIEEINSMKEVTARTLSYSLFKAGDITKGIVTGVTDEYATVWLMEMGLLEGRLNLKDGIWAQKRLTGKNVNKDTKFLIDAGMKDILKVGDEIKVGIVELGKDGKLTRLSLEQEPVVQGGLVAIDPSNGHLKALVGGYDFDKSEYNRAISAKRQPGSAFKPIIYAAALNKNYNLSSIIMDSPVVFKDTSTNSVWRPENYEKQFYGPITFREAIVHSRNLATINLLDEIGVRNVIKYAQKLGINSKLAPNLTLALGSSGVNLVELTSAYSVFASGGIHADPIFVLSVTNSSGEILEANSPKMERVESEETAYLMTNLLEDVVQNGTGRKAKILGRPVAGKTGTTNDFTDAWFVGYTGNLAAGVWTGFDDLRSIGNKEVGAKAALPIWTEFMKEAFAVLPPAHFKIPESIIFAKIDPHTGLLANTDTQEPLIEVFKKGTEPTVQTETKEIKTDFYEMDFENSL